MWVSRSSLRRLAAFGDDLAQIGHEVVRGRLASSSVSRVTPNMYICDHAVGPVEQLRRHLGRQPDHLGDDNRGDRRGEALDEFGAAVRLEAVDDLVGEDFDPRAQLLDMRDTKARLTSVLQPRVGRRLEREQRVFFGQVEGRDVLLGRRPAQFLAGRDMQDLAAEPLVAEEGAHILEAGEAQMAVVLPDKGRARGMLDRRRRR